MFYYIPLVKQRQESQHTVGIVAYLLLDQQDAAHLHFSRMTEDEKKQILQYPIGWFMRDK